jgi:hypothetical protein
LEELTGLARFDTVTRFPVFSRESPSVPDPNDDRSPLAKAATWVSIVTTTVTEMAAPPLFGFWLDEKLGTRLVFLSLGAIGGLALGMSTLIRVARADEKRGQRKP